MLNLTVVRGYVRELLKNQRVRRLLGARHEELLAVFERVAQTEEV